MRQRVFKTLNQCFPRGIKNIVRCRLIVFVHHYTDETQIGHAGKLVSISAEYFKPLVLGDTHQVTWLGKHGAGMDFFSQLETEISFLLSAKRDQLIQCLTPAKLVQHKARQYEIARWLASKANIATFIHIHQIHGSKPPQAR